MKTEAWIIERGGKGSSESGRLRKATIEPPDVGPNLVMVEPIYGCWEANMTHALTRDPVDVCRLRRDPHAVLGNAGVVRVAKTGPGVTTCREGDMCLVVPIGRQDEHGYPLTVLGYDEPHSSGLLAKQVVLHQLQLTKIPDATSNTYQQWAGFPVRFTTAWENWRLAFGLWKLMAAQMDEEPPIHVVGWGGGTTFAELQLARFDNCRTAMATATNQRAELLRGLEIEPLDRREFPMLAHDPQRYASDRSYRIQYLQSEGAFLKAIDEFTEGRRVSIFVDYIGAPLIRVTQKALALHGIITTAGWKCGSQLTIDRAVACLRRFQFVHTHACRRDEGVRSVEFAEQHGWLPPPGAEEYDWDAVPELAADYREGKIVSYFPVYRVNAP